MTTLQTKGTASGVYSFSHFMGNFVGAVLAGLWFHDHPARLFIIAHRYGHFLFLLPPEFSQS